MSHTRRPTWLAAALVAAACAVFIGAMAYEAYWAPRLCQVAEMERAPALQRIEKIGKVAISETDTPTKNLSAPVNKTGDE